MQKQQCRVSWVACFSIEDVEAVDIDGMISRSRNGDFFAAASQHSHNKSLIRNNFLVFASEFNSSQNPARFRLRGFHLQR